MRWAIDDESLDQECEWRDSGSSYWDAKYNHIRDRTTSAPSFNCKLLLNNILCSTSFQCLSMFELRILSMCQAIMREEPFVWFDPNSVDPDVFLAMVFRFVCKIRALREWFRKVSRIFRKWLRYAGCHRRFHLLSPAILELWSFCLRTGEWVRNPTMSVRSRELEDSILALLIYCMRMGKNLSEKIPRIHRFFSYVP